MRQLTPAQSRSLSEHDALMLAIKQDRARWTREQGQPSPARGLFGKTVVPPRRAAVPPPPPRYKSGEPWRVCLICSTPCFPVGSTLKCESCAAEVRWRSRLAMQGLKVVP